jgi:hypothetical protein
MWVIKPMAGSGCIVSRRGGKVQVYSYEDPYGNGLMIRSAGRSDGDADRGGDRICLVNANGNTPPWT